MNRDPRLVFRVQLLAGVLAASFVSLAPTSSVCEDEAKDSGGELLQNVFDQGKSLFNGGSPNKAREWEEKAAHAQAARAHERTLGGALGITKETPDEKAQGDKTQAEWKARRDAKVAEQRAEQKADQKAKDMFFDEFLEKGQLFDKVFKTADNTKANLVFQDLMVQHGITTKAEKLAEMHLDEAGVNDDATRKEIIEAASSAARDLLEKARDEGPFTPPDGKGGDFFEVLERVVADRVETKLEDATPKPPAPSPATPTKPAAPQPPAAPTKTPEALQKEEADRLALEALLKKQREALEELKKRDAFVAAVAVEEEKDPPEDPPKPPEETPPPGKGQQSELSDDELDSLKRLLAEGVESTSGQELRPLEGLTQEELAELRRQARANRPAQASAGSKPTNHVAPSQLTNEEYRRRAQAYAAAQAEKDRLEQRYLELASQLEGGVREREAWEAYKRELAAWEAANPVCPNCGKRHPPGWEPK